ncbi:MAG: filamentous hemagglutinin N-terminal domain-containing protein [Gammaproteobacteria bacterium]
MTYRKLSLRPLNALLTQALHSRALKRTALGLGAFAPAFAFANPTGGQVVAGNASINAPDLNHTIVNQASQSAILNWQQFSIGSNQYVQFIQPDSSAVVLNRVIGGNPSQILGNMSANGQVFLVNPNGVFFGQGASLDVQGLVATTFDIKDSDFMAGHYVFAKANGAPDAGVVNQGTLTANSGYIVLAGDYVNNDGVIAAQAGQVVLASGNQMTLTFSNDALVTFAVDQATLAQYAGVSNTGSIEADGGTVLMTAKVANALTATAVNNSGLITAHSIQDHNGTIILAAQGGDISESGTLDASGATDGVAGGNVVIRGNGHTEIASTASINAAGDNANGGFIELSGHTLTVRGNVDPGKGGTLYIDPSIITITNGAASSSGAVSYGGSVPKGFIQAQLNANHNVLLAAGSSIKGSAALTNLTATGAGNLKLGIGSLGPSVGFCISSFACLNSPVGVSFVPSGFGQINLSGVTINIKGSFTASAGTIDLAAVTAQGGFVANAGQYGYVTITGAVNAKTIDITGDRINTQSLTATGTGASAIKIQGHGSLDGSSQRIVVAGNITASNGGVNIDESGGYGVTVSGNINAAGPVNIVTSASSAYSGGAITIGGAITNTVGGVVLNATGGADSGGNISVGGAITAAGGVDVTATNNAGYSGARIDLANVTGKYVHINANGGAPSISVGALTANGAGGSSGVTVSTSGNGGITVNGAVTSNHGNVDLSVSGGSITVSGTISAGGSVSIHGSGALNGFNLGNITAGGYAYISEYGNITGANTLKVGNVTAGHSVDIYVSQYGPSASKLTTGNITAGSSAYISNYASYGGAVLTTGNVSGKYVRISDRAAAGQQAVLQTGAVSAVNASSAALVDISASGKNDIITTGAITATGMLNPNRSPLSEAGFNRNAAIVNLLDSGSGNATMTVNGGVTIKGTGAHYTVTRGGSNSYTASGSTGQAQLNIGTASGSAGFATIKITGAINETGMGLVGANISGRKVTVGGAINITATAGKMKQSGKVISGSLENINYSESGAALGRASLFISAGSTASLGGAVTLKGPSAEIYVDGKGGVTTRGITVTGSGEKFNHKATGKDSLGKVVNYSSNQSAGEAFAFLQAGSSGNAKTVNVKGAITVTGLGRAGVVINGGTIATQGIGVVQTAGKFSRTGQIPSNLFTGSSSGGPNPLGVSQQSQTGGGSERLLGIDQGTLTGGIAAVQLQGIGSTSNCSCQIPANAITVSGNINMSAAGDGEIWVDGKTVNISGGITGVATRATVNGTGAQSFNSGSNNYSVAHTVAGSGGRMHVDIRGIPGATSSGSSNNYTGTVTIGGAISLTGPTADLKIKSGSIKTGNITTNGTGEKLSVTDVYTPSGSGAAFTLKRSGVIEWTGIDLNGKAGTGVITTGNLLAEGPLFAGIHVDAGTVTVGNLGVIASTGSVTLLDTRISSTPLSFTAGDAGVAVSAVSGTGKATVFGAAKVNGNINIEATRDVHLLTNAVVSGYTLVTAGGNIDDPLPTNILRFLNERPGHNGSSSSHTPTLNLSTSGLALLAGGNITLNDATLKVGTGSVPGVVGDSIGIALLATQGLASTGTLPNATFVAGGTLGVGKFTLTGDYLYMEAANYNLSGPITVPTSTVVQFAPVSLPGSIGIEPGASTSSQLNLSGSLLNLFPGTTLMIGGSGTTGAVTIGNQGTITLNGGSNFLVFTAGNVTGLDKILTTGLVGNLLELVNFQVPTASEIQNTNNTSDDTDQKKKKNTNTGGTENGDSGGTVAQDDDTSGVCHG